MFAGIREASRAFREVGRNAQTELRLVDKVLNEITGAMADESNAA